MEAWASKSEKDRVGHGKVCWGLLLLFWETKQPLLKDLPAHVVQEGLHYALILQRSKASENPKEGDKLGEQIQSLREFFKSIGNEGATVDLHPEASNDE